MALKLPQIFSLHPDIGPAAELLERLNRTHFGQRVKASVKAGIPPLRPRRSGSSRLLGQIPAAGYLPGSRSIIIHPHVLNRDPPRFVLRYLLHHGLAEARQDQMGHGSTCHHALCPVLAYGNRVNRWLIAEGFPPLHEDTQLPEERLPATASLPAIRAVNEGVIEWTSHAASPMLTDEAEDVTEAIAAGDAS